MSGFARPKTEGSWIAQAVLGLGAIVVAVVLTSHELGFLAIGALIGGLVAVLWVEFEARCENRALVAVVGAAIIALSAASIARSNNRQE